MELQNSPGFEGLPRQEDNSACATLCTSSNVNTERLTVRASLRMLARERKIGYRRRLHNSFEFAREFDLAGLSSRDALRIGG